MWCRCPGSERPLYIRNTQRWLQITRDGKEPPIDWEKTEWPAADRPRTRPEWALLVGKFVVDQAIWRTVSQKEMGEVASPAGKKPAMLKRKAKGVKPQASSHPAQTNVTEATTVHLPTPGTVAAVTLVRYRCPCCLFRIACAAVTWLQNAVT